MGCFDGCCGTSQTILWEAGTDGLKGDDVPNGGTFSPGTFDTFDLNPVNSGTGIPGQIYLSGYWYVENLGGAGSIVTFDIVPWGALGSDAGIAQNPELRQVVGHQGSPPTYFQHRIAARAVQLVFTSGEVGALTQEVKGLIVARELPL